MQVLFAFFIRCKLQAANNFVSILPFKHWVLSFLDWLPNFCPLALILVLMEVVWSINCRHVESDQSWISTKHIKASCSSSFGSGKSWELLSNHIKSNTASHKKIQAATNLNPFPHVSCILQKLAFSQFSISRLALGSIGLYDPHYPLVHSPINHSPTRPTRPTPNSPNLTKILPETCFNVWKLKWPSVSK